MLNRFLSAALAIACVVLAIALFRHRAQQKNERSYLAMPAISPRATVAEDLALLNRHIDRVRLDNVTLDEAILTLSEQTKVNICADWRTLEAAGLSRSKRLRVHLDDVMLEQALQAVLMGLAEPKGAVGFSVCDGVVTIATPDVLARNTRTECFNIRALLEELRPGIRNFGWEPERSISEFKPPKPAAAQDALPTNEEIVERILRLITENVAPDSWRDSGGTIGSDREVAGLLIITQTPENLAAVADLLRQFHQAVGSHDLVPPGLAMLPATRPTASGGPPSTQPITQYVNLAPLIEKFDAERERSATRPAASGPMTKRDMVFEIEQLLTDTIEPDSWQSKGGTIGTIHQFGPIMAITQTPANLRAIRLTLDKLYDASSANGFPSATRPSAATTREAGTK